MLAVLEKSSAVEAVTTQQYNIPDLEIGVQASNRPIALGNMKHLVK
jgi:hypothetical protein